MLAGLAGERETGVAGNDIDVGGAVGEISELRLGDGDDGGVDVVEAESVAGAAIGGERAGAKTDDADAQGAGRREGAEGEADAGGERVIGGGLVAEQGIEDLGAVNDGAVGQLAEALVMVDELVDAESAVEIADQEAGILDVAPGFAGGVGGEHESGGESREPEGEGEIGLREAEAMGPECGEERERAGDQGDGEFVGSGKEVRGEESDEEAAECAAGGDG